MKRLMTYLLLMFTVSGAFASSSSQQAIAEYRNENYPVSAQWYQSMNLEKVNDPDILFNAGNAFLLAGDPVHAILSYERALKHDKGAEDILTNLEIAQTKAELILPIESKTGKTLVHRVGSIISGMNWWLLIWLVLGVLILVQVLYYFANLILDQIHKTLQITGSAVLVLILVISLTSSIFKVETNYGIIMTDVEMKQQPLIGGQVEVVLKAGEKVKTLERQGEWLEVELENGTRGYIEFRTISPV